MRREHLDHVLFLNACGLERKLAEFQTYYNELRVHGSLDGRTPWEAAELLPTPQARAHEYRWRSACGGLYELSITTREDQFATHRVFEIRPVD